MLYYLMFYPLPPVSDVFSLRLSGSCPFHCDAQRVGGVGVGPAAESLQGRDGHVGHVERGSEVTLGVVVRTPGL